MSQSPTGKSPKAPVGQGSRPETPGEAIEQSPVKEFNDDPSAHVYIETSTGKRLEHDFLPSDRINYIKARLQAMEGIASHEYRLVYDQQELENNKRLSDYQIKGGVVILEYLEQMSASASNASSKKKADVQDAKPEEEARPLTPAEKSAAEAASLRAFLGKQKHLKGFGVEEVVEVWSEASQEMWDDPKHNGSERRVKETLCEAMRKKGEAMLDGRKQYLHDAACENLKCKVCDDDPMEEPMKIQIAKSFGLLPLLIFVEKKRIRIQEEPIFAPDIYEVVTSLRFEAFVGVIIVLNMWMIGLDTYYVDGNRPLIMTIADNLLLAFYCFEVSCRVVAHQWVWFFEPWSIFDVIIIFWTGVMPLWILEPAGIEASWMRRFGCARALRLQRICRQVRMMPMFAEMWSLVNGLCAAGMFLFWSGIIGFVLHFMVAVAFVDMIGKNDLFVEDEYLQELFGSLGSAMFTLFQVMTLDGWADKARLTIEPSPSTAVMWYGFVGVAAIVLFNLMTAIMVKNAMDAHDQDTEAVQIEKQFAHLRRHQELMTIFQDMDEDGSGVLSKEEFFDCLDDLGFVKRMKCLDIELDELPDIFNVLDEGDGEVDAREFVNGMIKLQGQAKGVDITMAIKSMRDASAKANGTEAHLSRNAGKCLRASKESLGDAHRNIVLLQQYTMDFLTEVNKVGARRAVTMTCVQVPATPQIDMEKLVEDDKRKARKEEVERLRPKGLAPVEMDDESDGLRKIDKAKAVIKPFIAPSWTMMRQTERKEKELEKARAQVAGTIRALRESGQHEKKDKQDQEVDIEKAREEFSLMGDLQNRLDVLSVDIAKFNPDYLRLVAKIPRDELLKTPTSVQKMPRSFSRCGRSESRGSSRPNSAKRSQSPKPKRSQTSPAEKSSPTASTVEQQQPSSAPGERQLQPNALHGSAIPASMESVSSSSASNGRKNLSSGSIYEPSLPGAVNGT